MFVSVLAMHHLFKLLDASDNKPVSTQACVDIPELSHTARVLTKTAENLVKDNVFTESEICSYAFRHGYTLHAWRQYAQNYREQLDDTVDKAQLELSIARKNIAAEIAKNAALIKQAEEETIIKRKQAEEEVAIKRMQAEAMAKQAEAMAKQAGEETIIKRKQAEEEVAIKRMQAESSFFHVLKSWFAKSTK